MKSFALYIHYPFCIKKCNYCGFASGVDVNGLSRIYQNALLQELEYYAKNDFWKDKIISSIYIGGGTPSLMPVSFLNILLQHVKRFWRVMHKGEITIEINPSSINLDKIRSFHDSGINRISIGAQSFIQEELKLLGRTHSVEEIVHTVNYCKKTGFENISLDLIYGAPNQTINTIEYNLTRALEMDIKHISMYSLTIEEDTLFSHWVKEGIIQESELDQVADQYDLICFGLRNAGFEHYELTNFAIPDYWSRHNFSYWDRSSYLGLGTGAHSFNGLRRWWNSRNTFDYINHPVREKELDKNFELMSTEQVIQEIVYLSLRTRKGLGRNYAKEVCSVQELDYLIHAGILYYKNNQLHVSESKWLLLDEIVLKLIK